MSTASTPEQAPVVVVVVEQPDDWIPVHPLDMPPGMPRPIRGIALRSMTPAELEQYNGEIMTAGGRLWGYALEFAADQPAPEEQAEPIDDQTQADIEHIETVLENVAACECEGFSMAFDDYPAADIATEIETTLEAGFYVARLTIEQRIPVDAMPVVRAKAESARQFDRAAG
ncbi:MAG: hypothetical protein GXX96_38100 [Planctomycetaceae bacterium]|nr:hypothetical protein [Planctomycetaceae bacterium]